MDVQLTFRQEWNDSRLRYDDQRISREKFEYITVPNSNMIWTPNLFFANELKGFTHALMQPNEMVRVFPNGEVLYSKRISLKLTCRMDFKKFPFDRQTCTIMMASCECISENSINFNKFVCNFWNFETDAKTTEALLFWWKETAPVQSSKNLYLKNFVLGGYRIEYCTSGTNTGEYSCLKVDLMFDRNFYPYWTKIFVPSILIHILAWIPFWFGDNSPEDKSSKEKSSKEGKSKEKCSKNDKSTKKRFVLSLTALVLMIWFSVTISPIDSPEGVTCNRKSMWMGFIMLMNFVSFLHVCYLEKYGRSATCWGKKDKHSNDANDDAEKVPLQDEDATEKREEHSGKKKLASMIQKSKSVDCATWGRILYPLIFIIFNIFYWISAVM